MSHDMHVPRQVHPHPPLLRKCHMTYLYSQKCTPTPTIKKMSHDMTWYSLLFFCRIAGFLTSQYAQRFIFWSPGMLMTCYYILK